MQDLILVGSGGCMRELFFQIEELNKEKPTWNVIGFVDEYYDFSDEHVKRVQKKCPYLGKDEILLNAEKELNVAVCVGESLLRKKIVNKLKKNPNLHFPSIVLSNVKIAEDVKLGEGCIVSMGAVVSTGAVLGNFVFLNMDTMICHEGVLGDFVTLSPRVGLAGNVTIGEETEIGMAATVIQGIAVGERTIVAAGAVVVKNIESDVMAAGVPAIVKREKNTTIFKKIVTNLIESGI